MATAFPGCEDIIKDALNTTHSIRTDSVDDIIYDNNHEDLSESKNLLYGMLDELNAFNKELDFEKAINKTKLMDNTVVQYNNTILNCKELKFKVIEAIIKNDGDINTNDTALKLVADIVNKTSTVNNSVNLLPSGIDMNDVVDADYEIDEE